jgi:hypothetical protein
VRLSPLDTSATVGLLYQPQMINDDDYGAIGGMRIGRGNRSTRRKPAPVPLCPPQIPHDLVQRAKSTHWTEDSAEVQRLSGHTGGEEKSLLTILTAFKVPERIIRSQSLYLVINSKFVLGATGSVYVQLISRSEYQLSWLGCLQSLQPIVGRVCCTLFPQSFHFHRKAGILSYE